MRIASVIFICLVLFGQVRAQRLDSIQAVLKAYVKEDKQKVMLYCEASSALLNEDPQQAFQMAKKAYELAARLNDPAAIAEASLANAQILSQLKEYGEALQYLELAERKFTEAKAPDGLLRCTIRLSAISTALGRYPEALKYAVAALKMAEQSKDRKRIAGIYTSIGNIYFQSGYYQQSLDYTLKGLAAAREIKDEKLVSSLHNNLGALYLQLSDGENAKHNYLKALQFAVRERDLFRQSAVYFGLGQAELINNNTRKALEYFLTSANLDSLLGKEKNRLTAIGLGKSYMRMNAYDNAELNLMYAYENAVKSKDRTAQTEAASVLAELFAKTGDSTEHHRYSKIAGDTLRVAENEPAPKAPSEVTESDAIVKEENPLFSTGLIAVIGLITLVLAIIVYFTLRKK